MYSLLGLKADRCTCLFSSSLLVVDFRLPFLLQWSFNVKSSPTRFSRHLLNGTDSLSLWKHDGVPHHQLSFALEVVLPGNPNMHLDVTLDDVNCRRPSDIKKYYRPEFLPHCANHTVHSLSTWQIYNFTTQRLQFCTSLQIMRNQIWY